MGNEEETLREQIKRQSIENDWLRSSLRMIAGVEILANDTVNTQTLTTAKQSAATALEERSWFSPSSQVPTDAGVDRDNAVLFKVQTDAERYRKHAAALLEIALSDMHTKVETLRHIAQEALGLPKV